MIHGIDPRVIIVDPDSVTTIFLPEHSPTCSHSKKGSVDVKCGRCECDWCIERLRLHERIGLPHINGDPQGGKNGHA